MTVTYRKDNKTDTWRVFGPATLVRPGPVTVTMKSGEERVEQVARVSRPFDVDGIDHVYGYLAGEEQKTGEVCSTCGGTGRL